MGTKLAPCTTKIIKFGGLGSGSWEPALCFDSHLGGFGIQLDGLGIQLSGLEIQVSGLSSQLSGLGSQLCDLGSQLCGLDSKLIVLVDNSESWQPPNKIQLNWSTSLGVIAKLLCWAELSKSGSETEKETERQR